MFLLLAAALAVSASGTVTNYALNKRRQGSASGTGTDTSLVDELTRAGATMTSTTVFSLVEEKLMGELAGVLSRARHKSVADMASQVVAAIAANALKHGVVDFPPLVASEDDDGTIFVEWIFLDRRVGLTFDRDASQGGWHFISNGEQGISVDHGRISTLDPAALTRMALRS